jgi:hypothetical protein
MLSSLLISRTRAFAPVAIVDPEGNRLANHWLGCHQSAAQPIAVVAITARGIRRMRSNGRINGISSLLLNGSARPVSPNHPLFAWIL